MKLLIKFLALIAIGWVLVAPFTKQPKTVVKPVVLKPVLPSFYPVEVPELPLIRVLPEFAHISDITEKKRAFFTFLRPLVQQQNLQIRDTRQSLIIMQFKLSNKIKLSEKELALVAKLQKSYRVKQADLHQALAQLLVKVDELPEEIVLMQAANESAWGSSRFAREGLNLFGQWCYQEGCGIVPLDRPEGYYYEVAAYSHVQQSVKSYFKNINTNPAYAKLRQIRATQRKQQQALNAVALTEGLVAYSSRGEEYVSEIARMIQVNQKFLTD